MVQEEQLALSPETSHAADTVIPVAETPMVSAAADSAVASPASRPVAPPVDKVVAMPVIEAEDSVATTPDPVYALVYSKPPESEAAPLRPDGGLGVSFILCGLFILALVTSLRFRNNFKYGLAIFHNLINTRERQNVFDATVRETSLIILLNIMWCACAGIIGYSYFHIFHTSDPFLIESAVGMLTGMGVAAVYSLFMWGAYTSVGRIFSDKASTALWVKGFSSSQAFMAPLLFVTALFAISRPEAAVEAGVAAAAVFVLVKLVFIWKGYRIFFSEISSWVLFLCYLCSLEIVPLILCYRSAILLGKVL